MERLDFASVMAVIRRNINDNRCPNQGDLIWTLFRDVAEDENSYMDFDNGQVCRWLSGIARVSPVVSAYYGKNVNRRKLAQRIEKDILPMMPDCAMAVQELCDLIMQAPNVSTQKKADLTEACSYEEEEDMAIFMMDVLCFAMELRFEKRDIRKKQLIATGSLSPVVVDYIFDTDIPRPCQWFLGRERELERLHSLLIDNSKVFLHGIPGIGKSELAKAYAKLHSKEYTNVIYMNYVGDLKQNIIDLDFADDLPNEDREGKFKRHNRFLRSLREDTLIIVDNFNAVEAQDPLLDVIMKYRCRVLFTTRSRYENQPSMELFEMHSDTLCELMIRLFPKGEKRIELLQRIITLLHRHTFAVELAARLLAKGIHSPGGLLSKLEKEKASMDASDLIGTMKDGYSKRATYYDHIHSLFALSKLSKRKREALRDLTMIPEKGISCRAFSHWIGHRNMNELNDLITLGLLQPKNHMEILIHPMIREVCAVELKPSVKKCSMLLQSLETISLAHGIEFRNYRPILSTMDKVIEMIEIDDVPQYLRFLGNVFQFMDKYQHRIGMDAVIEAMEQLLSEPTNGTPSQRALYLDCCAAVERDRKKSIAFLRQAIEILGEIAADTAHLGANLHANLGGLYYQDGDLISAKEHMEKGAVLIRSYDLVKYHDCIAQIRNYAALLTNLGEADRAYKGLLELASRVAVINSTHCMDYALIQDVLASIAVVRGDLIQAQHHRQIALEAFESIFEDDRGLPEDKYREFGYA